jgi:membrane protease YdiL (CAAX protease family)
MNNVTELKPFWHRFFGFNWKFGLFLILIVCIPRFFLVLNANVTGNYGSIGLIMFISALAPFVFLSKVGRKEIGLTLPKKYAELFWDFVIGLIYSSVLYYLGKFLYGNSLENWFNYIGKSYHIPTTVTPHDKAVLFSITAFTGMIFSPVGEELFFRGIVYANFAKSFSGIKAATIESLAFALTHIAHFGLIYTGGQWKFLPMPTLIWILSMFLASLLFLLCKRRSGSLLGAVVCHAAFNLGMIFYIFYLL